MGRLSEGIFKGKARLPRSVRKAKNKEILDDGEVYDEEFAASISGDDLSDSSSYSLHSADGGKDHQEKPKSIKARLSGGLFKKKARRHRKNRGDSSADGDDDEDPEKVYDVDNASSASFDSAPMKRPVAKRALQTADSGDSFGNQQPRWSVAPDGGITKEFKQYQPSARTGMVVDEMEEDEDSDVYTSDEEENDNGGVAAGAESKEKPLIEGDRTVGITSQGANDEEPKSKKKKKKKPDSGALDAHLETNKKKKKLKKGSLDGSTRSLKSTKSTKSVKSTASTKSKKKTKNKKTLETIESQADGEYQSFAVIEKKEDKKLKKLKSTKKKTTKKKATTTEDDDKPIGEVPPPPKTKSIFIASSLLKEKIRNSLQSLSGSFMSTEGSQHGGRISNHGTPPSTTRKIPSFSLPTSPLARTSRKVSQPPMSPRIDENENSGSEFDDDDDGGTTPTPKNPEEIDGEKIKADAVKRIRAFAIMLGSINNQKEFLEAFGDSDSDEEGAANGPVDEKLKKRLEKVVAELYQCEALLETERRERSQEKYDMRMKQESVEQLLNEEAEKNVMLQAQIDQLQEQLENAREAYQVEELKAKNLMLEAENDLFRQKNERNQETIASLVREAEESLKRKASEKNADLSDGEGVMDLKEESADDDSDIGQNQNGVMPMSSARAQGKFVMQDLNGFRNRILNRCTLSLYYTRRNFTASIHSQSQERATRATSKRTSESQD